MKYLQDLSSQFTPIGKTPEVSVHSLGLMPLLKQLLQENSGHISQISERGYAKPDLEDRDNVRFLKKMEEMGGRLIHKTISQDSYDAVYLWDHGAANVIAGGNGYVQFYVVSLDTKWSEDLLAYIQGNMSPAAPKGYIFAIIRNGGSYTLSQVGNAAIPLETGNYTPSVIESYKFVVRDLAAVSPSGRIVILEGEPGTGKTHLIRGWLNDVHNSMFVVVSPDMMPSLAGPDLLPLLINTKSTYSITGPIILILEDADLCLVKREGDNMSFIQSLLNLGDGILGSMLDLRIIATTNARKLEMEGAILRPGRLSRRIEVGPLDSETARQVFNRLLPNVPFSGSFEETLATVGFSRTPTPSKMTLAEVYALARKHGWEPRVRESNVGSTDSASKPSEAYDKDYDDDDD